MKAMPWALAPALMLGGCISLTPDPPDQLLTLTPAAMLPTGAEASGSPVEALAVAVPAAPQRLNVARVPVSTSDSALAYLVDAVWVERPAILFRRVLAETIRARGARMVVESGELEYAAATVLGGELTEMGYDAGSASVVVRYDAVLTLPDGTIRTRRFEQREAGVEAEAEAVGAALNRTANSLAAEVADWVG